MIADAAVRRPAVFVIFDLLEVDGDDLRTFPLFERRKALHAHVEPVPGIQNIEHVETHGEALFHAIERRITRGSLPSGWMRRIARVDVARGSRLRTVSIRGVAQWDGAHEEVAS